MKNLNATAGASPRDVVIESNPASTQWRSCRGHERTDPELLFPKGRGANACKHMGITVQKEAKEAARCSGVGDDPERLRRGVHPAHGFQESDVDRERQREGIEEDQLRTALRVEGQSIPITYEKMDPRMDMVRTSGMARTPDVRFRPEFVGWKARMVT